MLAKVTDFNRFLFDWIVHKTMSEIRSLSMRAFVYL